MARQSVNRYMESKSKKQNGIVKTAQNIGNDLSNSFASYKNAAQSVANAVKPRATQGLITNPIVKDYDYTKFIGNTQQVRDAFQKATGYVPTGNTASGFAPASVVNRTSANRYDTSHYGSKAGSSGASGGIGISGGYGYGSIPKIDGFRPSQAYLDAMAYTQSLLDKINSGRTSYSDKVDEMMSKIENRDKFSYDFNNDPLFQNMLGSAMASGQTAMQDTMGQAAALTGGYGSSYATSAGNQAYNQFVQQAYAQLPEYYKLALDAYTREGDEMYRQLGMYNDADDKEYGRLTNAYGLNYQQAQDMYGHEYNNYWDTANYNFNVDKENYDRYKDAMSYSLSAAKAAAKASGAGTGASAEDAGASSADFQKALNYANDLMGVYNYDSDALMEGVMRIANQFGLSQAQLETLWSQLKATSDSRMVGRAAGSAIEIAKRANKNIFG